MEDREQTGDQDDSYIPVINLAYTVSPRSFRRGEYGIVLKSKNQLGDQLVDRPLKNYLD